MIGGFMGGHKQDHSEETSHGDANTHNPQPTDAQHKKKPSTGELFASAQVSPSQTTLLFRILWNVFSLFNLLVFVISSMTKDCGTFFPFTDMVYALQTLYQAAAGKKVEQGQLAGMITIHMHSHVGVYFRHGL
jgi:hypothetical protein